MKMLLMAILGLTLVSCGSDSSSGNGSNSIQLDQLDGEKKISYEKVVALYNEYKETTATVSTGETALEKETSTYDNCITKTQYKRVFLNEVADKVELYVEEKEEKNCKDEVTASESKYVEIHKYEDFYGLDLEELKKMTIYQGTKNGEKLLRAEGAFLNNGYNGKFQSIVSIERSMLKFNLKSKTIAKTKSGTAYEIESETTVLPDTDVSLLELDGLPRYEINYKND
ncbi:hypothetical protein HBN50_02845 [Halobacteriovorax sp. GB3]|uniref:hypothetical protein n=1 Tax=Halobacteriovorax sp. GB3 TaxID=2719615 RepID=UPI0023609870|nr:hypothetical protein [Halobacteriovorax sp. GB3]MDD0852013.1 hypothetical protein [Halobacteriovorax sp. GB3]